MRQMYPIIIYNLHMAYLFIGYHLLFIITLSLFIVSITSYVAFHRRKVESFPGISQDVQETLYNLHARRLAFHPRKQQVRPRSGPRLSATSDIALHKCVSRRITNETFILCVSNEKVRRISRPGCEEGRRGAAREGKLRVDV